MKLITLLFLLNCGSGRSGRAVTSSLGVPPYHAGRGSIHYIFRPFNRKESPFRTCFVPNKVLITNGIAGLIHLVRVGGLWPPNVADSVTFPR